MEQNCITGLFTLAALRWESWYPLAIADIVVVPDSPWTKTVCNPKTKKQNSPEKTEKEHLLCDYHMHKQHRRVWNTTGC